MIALALWIATTLAAPLLARRLWQLRPKRWEPWDDEVQAWARLGYGILPLYGAWVSGAIVARDAGLRASWPGTAAGGALCALALGVLWLASLRPAWADRMRRWVATPTGWQPLADEPRWGFYRGAAAVLVGSAWSQLVGLGLGAAEWLILRRSPVQITAPQSSSGLVRLGVSAALFALTGNLWLVVATTAAGRAILWRR